MSIDKNSTGAMISMAADMRAARKAVKSLSMVDLKKVEQKVLELFEGDFSIKCESLEDIKLFMFIMWKNKIVWRTGDRISKGSITGYRCFEDKGFVYYSHRKHGNESPYDKCPKGYRNVLCWWDKKVAGNELTMFQIQAMCLK